MNHATQIEQQKQSTQRKISLNSVTQCKARATATSDKSMNKLASATVARNAWRRKKASGWQSFLSVCRVNVLLYQTTGVACQASLAHGTRVRVKSESMMLGTNDIREKACGPNM